MSVNSFGAKSTLTVGDASYEIFRLDAVEGSDSLPYSLKILLENLLRTEDGANITADDIRALAGWDADAEPSKEIQFTPARVIMQDFTGVPCVVDLATMREAMADMGGDPAKINPLAPAEMVIDHSVIADVFGTADSFVRNVEIEYGRNRERYQFLRWGQTAFDDFKVVPPGTGIVHQVNIEHLARVIFPREVDGDRPTPIRTPVSAPTRTPRWSTVSAWSAGASAGSRPRRPCSASRCRCSSRGWSGFKLSGAMPEGATATDLVLTITEMLRQHKVVGKFVEFYGPGVSQVPLANRATIGNMSPEYGSTIAVFPIDAKTTDYLRLTGRSEEQIALVETYAKEQGLWHDDDREAKYSEYLELDLATRRAEHRRAEAAAGPGDPGPRQAGLPRGAARLRRARGHRRLRRVGRRVVPGLGLAQSRHAATDRRSRTSTARACRPTSAGRARRRQVTLADGTEFEIDHGAVTIAAITSCTNTSNPSVMIGAALVAKKAVERGLTRKPWVKTTLAPGSKVVSDYYDRSGSDAVPGQARLQPGRLRLHHLHRQLRAADPRGQRGGAGERSGRGLGAVGQPELRGPDQPRRQDELPGVAAAGGGVRAGRARWTST